MGSRGNPGGLAGAEHNVTVSPSYLSEDHAGLLMETLKRKRSHLQVLLLLMLHFPHVVFLFSFEPMHVKFWLMP
jgi:hypothetical protein